MPTHGAESAPGEVPRGAAQPDTARPRSNRRVVGVLALIMAVMAAVGLAFALWTIKDRRKRDPKEPTKVEVTAPAELALLGYLPGDTDVVLGLHVAELLEMPHGRDLIERVRLPIRDAGLHSLQQVFGIRVEDIDHLVIGVRTASGGVLPRTTILVQTRKPIDTRKATELLKAGAWKKAGGKNYRPFRLPGPLGFVESALWFTGDDYRMIVHNPESLVNALPDAPQPGIDHLAPPLKQFLRERTRGMQAWAVGDVEDWNQTFLGPAMDAGAIPEAVGKAVMNLRGFRFWTELGDGLQMSAHIEGRDAAAAAALAALLKFGGRAERLFGGQPELRPLNRELDKNLRLELKDKRIILQTKASAETLRKAMAPPAPDAEKKEQ